MYEDSNLYLLQNLQEQALKSLNKKTWKQSIDLYDQYLRLSSINFTEVSEHIGFVHKYTEALFSLADVLIDGNRCLTAIKALKSFKKHSKSFDLLSTKNQNSIYNRIACGYRKLGKLERAKKYIEKVLENSDEKSEGYLNMCAILSNQNDHINALKYAKSAVESIENELNDNNAKEKNTVLGIAYHNIAVEYEHLNKKSISAEFHKKAFNMMKTQENLNLLLRFKSNYEQVNNEAKKSLTRPKSAVTLNLRTKNYLDLKGVRNSKGSLRTTPLRNPFKESANLAFMKKSRTSGTSLKDQLSDFEEDTSSDMKETQREPVWLKNATKRKLIRSSGSKRPPIMASFAITKPTLKFCQSEKNIIKEESSIMDMPKPGFERANKPIIHSVFYKNPQNISNLSDSFKQAIPGLLNYKNTLKFEAAIKIQAVYRGLKAREKFKLLKVKPNIIFKAGKIIDEIPYQIHIIQNKSKCYLLISDSKNEVKFEISADIEPKKAVKMLAFDPHNGFYLKKSNEMDTNELIRQNTLLIDDESYEIKYYSNLFLDLIKLKLINNSTNRKFKCKKTKDFLNKSEMIQYINEKIEPNLRIINDRLVIYENNNEDINILCKGRVTSNDLDLEIKIYNRDEFFEINIDKLIKFISKTDIKSIESFKDDPNILLLYAQINLNDINFHITDTKLLHSSKQLLNDSNPYSVNIYQTDNLYLISTYEKSLPLISSIIISADEILEAFESKSLEACLKIIPENLKIESGQLHFDLKNEHLLNINRIKQVRNDEDYLMTSERMEAIMKSVVKIQKVYRGHRTRDILKFHYPKISLLQNTKLQIGANFFVFSIFKLFQGVLIEAYNEVDKKMFIKAIENPKDYIKNFNKYSDIKLLLVRVVDFEGNLAMLKSNASKHKVGVQDVDFFIQNTSTDTSDIKTNEKWPVFIKKKINSSPYIIQGSLTSIKSLHILIIPLFTGGKSYSKNYSEIDIIENCGKFDPRSLLNKVILDGEKIDIKGRKEIQSGNVLVYQTCKIFENKNYQVKVNLQSKNPGKAAIDDIMVFSIKDKSKHDETQILQIKLKKASKQTGINANMHMQIAIVLTKNLRLKNGIFLISFKPKKIDYIQATVKIQAIIRGFLSRRKFMKIYKKLLFEKFTLISGQRYKIKLFSIQDYYLIEAIKGGKSFLHRFISEISDPESFMESLDFYIEQVNGVKRLGGLQHLKYAKNKNGKKKLISTENKIISAENCELSIYDINSKMRYEVKIGENVLYLNFKKEIVNDIEEFTKMLEISDDKTELRHPMKDADAVLYSDSRFISNKLGKLFIFIKNSEYFASFFLVNESRSLILNLGASINADESIRKLRIVNDELTLIN